MSEASGRQSPLAGLMEPGTYGGGEPGVAIEERRDVAQLQLVARNGKTEILAKRLARFLGRKKPLGALEGAENKGLFICTVGPRETWVFAEDLTPADALQSLSKAAGDSASIFDQSEGRVMLHLAGEKAADILAKGSALDFHGPGFPATGAAYTVIEHIPVLVAKRSDADAYDISVPRSYAVSFLVWLRGAARDSGYVIGGER